jgi:hypothetical protein
VSFLTALAPLLVFQIAPDVDDRVFRMPEVGLPQLLWPLIGVGVAVWLISHPQPVQRLVGVAGLGASGLMIWLWMSHWTFYHGGGYLAQLPFAFILLTGLAVVGLGYSHACRPKPELDVALPVAAGVAAGVLVVATQLILTEDTELQPEPPTGYLEFSMDDGTFLAYALAVGGSVFLAMFAMRLLEVLPDRKLETRTGAKVWFATTGGLYLLCAPLSWLIDGPSTQPILLLLVAAGTGLTLTGRREGVAVYLIGIGVNGLASLAAITPYLASSRYEVSPVASLLALVWAAIPLISWRFIRQNLPSPVGPRRLGLAAATGFNAGLWVPLPLTMLASIVTVQNALGPMILPMLFFSALGALTVVCFVRTYLHDPPERRAFICQLALACISVAFVLVVTLFDN